MNLKTLFMSAGCVACWIGLFPVVVIGGGLAIFLIAVGAELSHLITGSTGEVVDPSTAHEMAMRICFGYRAQRRTSSRSTH